MSLIFRGELPCRKRPAASSSSTRANRPQGRGAKPRASRGYPAGSLVAEGMLPVGADGADGPRETGRLRRGFAAPGSPEGNLLVPNNSASHEEEACCS